MTKRYRLRSPRRRVKSSAGSAIALTSTLFRSASQIATQAIRRVTSAPAKPAGRGKAAAVPAPPPKPRKQATPRPRTVAVPRSASFRTAVHECAFGKRRYKIYTPKVADHAGPLPLLVMLHGCGQTPDDFAKGTRMNALAEEKGLLVVYPAQPRDANPNRCWNWFRRGDQIRGSGEPALIASLVREVLDRHPADPARVYVAGLSAGGSAALILAGAYPDIFAAVGTHSGIPAGAARDKTSALIAMRQGNPGDRRAEPIPTIIFHGSDDHIVSPRNSRLAVLRALEPFPTLRATEVTRKVAEGRSYVHTTHRIGQGRPRVEFWLVKGSGHAWSGGSPAGRFVDPQGPDASREMVRFFLRHRLSARKLTTSLSA